MPPKSIHIQQLKSIEIDLMKEFRLHNERIKELKAFTHHKPDIRRSERHIDKLTKQINAIRFAIGYLSVE